MYIRRFPFDCPADNILPTYILAHIITPYSLKMLYIFYIQSRIPAKKHLQLEVLFLYLDLAAITEGEANLSLLIYRNMVYDCSP